MNRKKIDEDYTKQFEIEELDIFGLFFQIKSLLTDTVKGKGKPKMDHREVDK
jgi:hypothetical protein